MTGLSFPASPSREPQPFKSRSDAMMTAYRVLRMLVTDPKDTKAYKLGIVDGRGKRLRRPWSAKDREAYDHLQRLVFRLQEILRKAPGGKTRLSNWSAATWLVREAADGGRPEKMSDDKIVAGIHATGRTLCEDGIANAVGGGHIAAVGVGPDGEPGVDMKKRRKRRKLVLGGVLRRVI